MSVIRIMTNFNIELEFPAAPFHRRLLAWVIDFVILFLYLWLGAGLLTYFAEKTAGSGVLDALAKVMLIPLLTYHLLCEVFMNGQSFGKKIVRIRVVNENGGRPSLSQFIIRWLIRTSDIMVLIIIILAMQVSEQRGALEEFWKIGVAVALFIVDIVMVNATKKNQRLGDLLAHTFLINARQKHSISDTVFLQIAEDYVPSFPQVMQLSDKDINSLKSILDAARGRGDDHLAEMASNKIRNHLNIETPLAPLEFLQVLLKDYNYLSVQ